MKRRTAGWRLTQTPYKLGCLSSRFRRQFSIERGALDPPSAVTPSNGDPPSPSYGAAGRAPLLQRGSLDLDAAKDSSGHFPNFSQNRFSLACCLPLASRRKGARTARFMIHLFRTLSGQRRGRMKSTKRTTR